MPKGLLNFIKSNKGFSLLEAIVSVVIVGIAIIPISTVFNMTITRTLDTRRQMEANEIGQQYMESLKSMDFNELGSVLVTPGYVLTLTDTTAQSDFDNYGFERIPDGYSVELSYDNGVDQVDGGTYAIDSASVTHITSADIDAVITIDSGYDSDFIVTDSDGSSGAVDFNQSISSVNRNIRITVDRDSMLLTVKAWDGSNELNANVYTQNVANNAVKVVMGDGTAAVGAVAYNTTISVDSNLTTPFTVYIFEDSDNTVNASTQTIQGYVAFSRNLYEATSTQYRVVGLTVDVYSDVTGELVTSLTSTKTSE